MKYVFSYIKNWMHIVYLFFRLKVMSIDEKDLRIIALESQLALMSEKIINRKAPKPRSNLAFRQLWVILSMIFPAWEEALMLVMPETVIRWHKTAFKAFWRFKSKRGRPKISKDTIGFIRQIQKENPTLSAEKIYERLIALNVTDVPSPNSIRKYTKHLGPSKTPNYKHIPGSNVKQTWKTFTNNHLLDIWSMDFAVVPTLFFKPLYVLFIINHARRKIEYINVTANPDSEWLKQQFRNATPFGYQPKYLIHDNDSVFKSVDFQLFLRACNIKSIHTSFRSPWQNGICERLIGIVRRDLLDHIIPLSQSHLQNLLSEYMGYYNNVRTHQTLGGETPVKTVKPPPSKIKDTILISKPILGGLYHDYQKAA